MRNDLGSLGSNAEKPNLAIWGAGGHAKVVADIVRLGNQFTIVGFLEDATPSKVGETFIGHEILAGSDATLEQLRHQQVSSIFVAVGNCASRLRIMDHVRKMGFALPILIHPFTSIAEDVQIGEGTVVAAGAIICPGASLGRGIIVNTASSIDHDCIIGDAVHICPGTRLAGSVKVGCSTWVGIGSSVKENITIGANVTIGAGSVVVNNIGDNVVAFGVPAVVNSPNSSS